MLPSKLDGLFPILFKSPLCFISENCPLFLPLTLFLSIKNYRAMIWFASRNGFQLVELKSVNQLVIAITLSKCSFMYVSSLCLLDQKYFKFLQPRLTNPFLRSAYLKSYIYFFCLRPTPPTSHPTSIFHWNHLMHTISYLDPGLLYLVRTMEPTSYWCRVSHGNLLRSIHGQVLSL